MYTPHTKSIKLPSQINPTNKIMKTKNPVWTVVAAVMLITRAPMVMSAIDCTTVLSLISACSTFVTYGSPDPLPGSPCCDAITSLNGLSDSTENKQSVCRCLMGLITTYNPNATAIATLPGFCGVSLGFTIAPNTDCEFITEEVLT